MTEADAPRRDFLGQVALVTGAASGIGLATARLLAAAGAAVSLADLDEHKGEAAAAEIRQQGCLARYVPCDVRRAESCERAVALTVSAFGKLNILVNAAGVVHRANVPDTLEQDWDHTLEVNLKGVYLACKFAIPVIVRGGGGAIVNVSSGWGIVGGRRAAAYCASKGGVVLLTKAMAMDHAAEGIRVNCLCPGDTDTPMLRSEAGQLGMSEDQYLAECARRPMGRIGRPEEIARAILYLAGPDASYVTGTTLVVDGGGLAGT
jgi:NAD(P)-dependent dehydrogenase (short-subunit alcohol dehydrogenase family)